MKIRLSILIIALAFAMQIKSQVEAYIGEIRMFAGNFPPVGWAFCNGSLLNISENDVLFTLIGTTYGGDGQNTFALPAFRGRAPLPVRPQTSMGDIREKKTVT